jgi:hypothetical protein
MNFLVQEALVIRALFIYEFKIRGPKRWNELTANNEGNLYFFNTPSVCSAEESSSSISAIKSFVFCKVQLQL